MVSVPVRRTRVLVVDDSATARLMISRALAADPRFEVVGALRSAEEVLERIESLAPDVMTLDLDLPGMSGIELLQRLRPVRPVPVVVVSAHSGRGAKLSIEAFEAGAVDVVEKPGPQLSPDMMLQELRTKVAIASTARLARFKQHEAIARAPAPPRSTTASAPLDLVLIGASTGGPGAIQTVLAGLPAHSPPVLVAVHMPGGFTQSFAQRLNDVCRLAVAEARDGDELVPGRALIAPGGMQLRIKKHGSRLIVQLRTGERVNGHAPSVDVLFESAAQAVGRRCAAALLSGMGADGAQGMLLLRRAGARTLSQDEASCVVFGMPKAAWDIGAAEALVPLDEIAGRLLR